MSYCQTFIFHGNVISNFLVFPTKPWRSTRSRMDSLGDILHDCANVPKSLKNARVLTLHALLLHYDVENEDAHVT